MRVVVCTTVCVRVSTACGLTAGVVAALLSLFPDLQSMSYLRRPGDASGSMFRRTTSKKQHLNHALPKRYSRGQSAEHKHFKQQRAQLTSTPTRPAALQLAGQKRHQAKSLGALACNSRAERHTCATHVFSTSGSSQSAPCCPAPCEQCPQFHCRTAALPAGE